MQTDLTVGAVIAQRSRFLIIEEMAYGRRVFTQPGGHIEQTETAEQAVIREVREETGCDIAVDALLGVYRWSDPDLERRFVRIMFTGHLVRQHADARLDNGIIAAHWLTRAEISLRRANLRSPVVERAVDDLLAGQLPNPGLLEHLRPVQRNLGGVLESAAQL